MLWAPHQGHNKRTSWSTVSENGYFPACWAVANELGYSFMLCCTEESVCGWWHRFTGSWFPLSVRKPLSLSCLLGSALMISGLLAAAWADCTQGLCHTSPSRSHWGAPAVDKSKPPGAGDRWPALQVVTSPAARNASQCSQLLICRFAGVYGLPGRQVLWLCCGTGTEARLLLLFCARGGDPCAGAGQAVTF